MKCLNFLTFVAIALMAAATAFALDDPRDLVRSYSRPIRNSPLDEQFNQLRYVKTTNYGQTWTGVRRAGDLSLYSPNMGGFPPYSAIVMSNNQICYGVYLANDSIPGVYALPGPNFVPVLVMENGTHGLANYGWVDIGRDPNGDLFIIMWAVENGMKFWASKSVDNGASWNDPFIIAESPDLDANAQYPHISDMNSNDTCFVIYQIGITNEQRVLHFPTSGGPGLITSLTLSSGTDVSYYTGNCKPIAFDPNSTPPYLYVTYRGNPVTDGVVVYYSTDYGRTFTGGIEIPFQQRYPSMALRTATHTPFVISNVGVPNTGDRHWAWFSYDSLGYGGGAWTAPDTLAILDDGYDGTRPLIYQNEAYFWDSTHAVASHNLWGSFTPEGLYTSRSVDGGLTWTDFSLRWQDVVDSLQQGFSQNCELVGGADGVAYVIFNGIYQGNSQYASVSGTVSVAQGMADVRLATVSIDSAESVHPAADGTFTFENVLVDSHFVTVSHPDCDPIVQHVEVTQDGLTGLTYALNCQPCVQGAVFGTWTLANSPVRACGDIHVNPGDTLRIEPGVTVSLFSGARLSVFGVLLAQGTAADSIRFVSNNPAGNVRWSGVHFETPNSGSLLEYCVFQNARNPDGQTGVVDFWQSSGELRNCVIRSCDGAVSCYGSEAIFDHCLITGNHGSISLIQLQGSSPLFDHCSVLNNSMDSSNSAVISCLSDSSRFVGCLIRNNHASRYAGFYFRNGSVDTLVNCVIADNRADSGSAVNIGAPVTIVNSVIANSQSTSPYAAVVLSGTGITMVNTIISNCNGHGLSFRPHSDSTRINHCDIYGNALGDFIAEGAGALLPQGLGVRSHVNANLDSCDRYQNIYMVPKFIARLTNNFHLADSSHCIGAGNPNVNTTEDIEGNPRPNPAGSICDMGAFESPRSGPITLGASEVPVPREFSFSAYPNPFNPVTELSFTLPAAGRVKLTVFDLTGREVRTLANGVFTSGWHSVSFDARDLPSGIYFARISTERLMQTRKIVLLK
jgi:hypothetical protein